MRFADNPFVISGPEIRFYAGAPLVNPEGLTLGTLCVLDLAPRTISSDKQRIMERLAETVVTTLELRRTVNRVRRLALTDALTGLANRAALIDALDHVIGYSRRHGGTFGLLYLDLDGFKQVNDSLGHGVGDAVLHEVAQTLKLSLRQEDMVARLGGDEFAVLLVGVEVDAEKAALRIRTDVESAMISRQWAVTASVGAMSFHAAPQSVDEALAAADALMYRAKVTGKNNVVHSCLPPSVKRMADKAFIRQAG